MAAITSTSRITAKLPYKVMRQPLRPIGLGDHGCPIPQWRRQ